MSDEKNVSLSVVLPVLVRLTVKRSADGEVEIVSVTVDPHQDIGVRDVEEAMDAAEFDYLDKLATEAGLPRPADEEESE